MKTKKLKKFGKSMLALGLVATGVTGFAAKSFGTTSVVNATTPNQKLYEQSTSSTPSTLEYRFGDNERILNNRRGNNSAYRSYEQEIQPLSTDEYNQKVQELNTKYQPMFKLKDSINELENKQQQYWALHEEYHKELRQITSQWSNIKEQGISNMLRYINPRIYISDNAKTTHTRDTKQEDKTINTEDNKTANEQKTDKIDNNGTRNNNSDNITNNGIGTQDNRVQTPTQYNSRDNRSNRDNKENRTTTDNRDSRDNDRSNIQDNKPLDNGIANGIRSYIQDRRTQTDKTPSDRYNGQAINHNNRYNNTIGIHTSGGRIATSRDRNATIKRPPIQAPNPNITTPTTEGNNANPTVPKSTTPNTTPNQPTPKA